jgi:Zn-dependent alcohol dehydrogenase
MPEEEVAGTVRELTGGGAEVAVEAVGSTATLRQAFESLKPGGRVIAVGLSSVKAEAAVPLNALVQQQKQLVGSLYGSSNPAVDLPRLLDLYRTGQLPLDQLVGETYPLEGLEKAYDGLRGGAVGRAIIDPSLVPT